MPESDETQPVRARQEPATPDPAFHPGPGQADQTEQVSIESPGYESALRRAAGVPAMSPTAWLLSLMVRLTRRRIGVSTPPPPNPLAGKYPPHRQTPFAQVPPPAAVPAVPVSPPATDLFNSPVLLIEQPSPQFSYRITDPQGRVLATARQVGGKKKNKFQRLFGTGETSRLIVQVSGPDGTPLFFVDRAARQQVTALQPPCVITAADGAQVGRIEHNTASAVHDFGQASPKMRHRYDEAEATGELPAYRLVDAANQTLCELTPEAIKYVRRQFDSTPDTIGRRFITYTDVNQVQIARLNNDESAAMLSERTALQLQFQLPDPLRVLVIASPIAIDIMTSAVFGGS
jgi:hypothetical protein